VLLSVVFLLHVIPLLVLTLPPPPILPVLPVTDEPLIATLEIKIEDVAELLKPPDRPVVTASEKLIVMPALKVPPEPSIPVKVEEVPKPPLPPVATASPVQPPPVPPQDTKPAAETERKLNPVHLNPLKPTVGYDQSKETKEVPPESESLKSDRTSTAADKGPKDLPTGAPFMPDGQSTEIRESGHRGEGNLPPVASDPKSGSVDKTGSPDAGKGPQEKERSPDKKMPAAPPALKNPKDEKNTGDITEDKKPLGKETIQEKTPAVSETIPLEKMDDAPPKKIIDTKNLELDDEAGDIPTKTKIKKPLAEPVAPPKTVKVFDPKIDTKKSAVTPPDPNATKSTVAEQKVSDTNEPAATAPKMKVPTELELFEAKLESIGKTDGRGGNKGDSSGINARKGKMGHEGDGTLRPGDDGAVSDIVTLNRNSSAKDFDESRFAKRTDEKAKYFKALFKRIDTKWKAEISRRSRFRFENGWVVMKIVVSREGKLLSATEVSRTPKDFKDEYVTLAKQGIELAADPDTESFPESLQQYEKLECDIGFGY
jgi:hypothetical protein